MQSTPSLILASAAIGTALGSLLLVFLLAAGGDAARTLLAEALTQPWQLPAIWFGAVAPFAVGFVATSLVASDVGPPAGRDSRRPVPVRLT